MVDAAEHPRMSKRAFQSHGIATTLIATCADNVKARWQFDLLSGAVTPSHSHRGCLDFRDSADAPDKLSL